MRALLITLAMFSVGIISSSLNASISPVSPSETPSVLSLVTLMLGLFGLGLVSNRFATPQPPRIASNARRFNPFSNRATAILVGIIVLVPWSAWAL